MNEDALVLPDKSLKFKTKFPACVSGYFGNGGLSEQPSSLANTFVLHQVDKSRS